MLNSVDDVYTKLIEIVNKFEMIDDDVYCYKKDVEQLLEKSIMQDNERTIKYIRHALKQILKINVCGNVNSNIYCYREDLVRLCSAVMGMRTNENADPEW